MSLGFYISLSLQEGSKTQQSLSFGRGWVRRNQKKDPCHNKSSKGHTPLPKDQQGPHSSWTPTIMETCSWMGIYLQACANEGRSSLSNFVCPFCSLLFRLLSNIFFVFLHQNQSLFEWLRENWSVGDVGCPKVDEFQMSSIRQHQVGWLHLLINTLRSRWTTPIPCTYSTILTSSAK